MLWHRVTCSLSDFSDNIDSNCRYHRLAARMSHYDSFLQHFRVVSDLTSF